VCLSSFVLFVCLSTHITAHPPPKSHWEIACGTYIRIHILFRCFFDLPDANEQRMAFCNITPFTLQLSMTYQTSSSSSNTSTCIFVSPIHLSPSFYPPPLPPYTLAYTQCFLHRQSLHFSTPIQGHDYCLFLPLSLSLSLSSLSPLPPSLSLSPALPSDCERSRFLRRRF